jgi:hypothetical protein
MFETLPQRLSGGALKMWNKKTSQFGTGFDRRGLQRPVPQDPRRTRRMRR